MTGNAFVPQLCCRRIPRFFLFFLTRSRHETIVFPEDVQSDNVVEGIYQPKGTNAGNAALQRKNVHEEDTAGPRLRTRLRALPVCLSGPEAYFRQHTRKLPTHS